MAGQKDFITSPFKISKELTFEQKQLYKYFKKWFKERHYFVVELDYSERESPEGRRLYVFNWYSEKRVEEFTKLCIEVEFNADTEKVRVEMSDGKKKTAQRGIVTATFQGYIMKDVDSEWALTKERPHRRLFREFFDKLVNKGKYAQFENTLNKDMRAIMSDFKTYLKTHRYD